MTSINLHEHFFWSPILGEDAVRFSVFDNHGQEYFSIRPIAGHKSLREERQAVAERIHAAMTSGRDPGEV